MKRDRDANVQIIVRRKGRHAAHHGGAWKVALADFMSAMFCLFLVLWLINQSSDIKSAIAGYFQDPLGRGDEYGSSIIPGSGAQTQVVRQPLNPADVVDVRRDRMQSAANRLSERLAASPELGSIADNVEITLTHEGLRIELIDNSSDFFFLKGEPVPTARGRQIFAVLGGELGALSFPMRIEGHTDSHPFHKGESYTNWELSADRANAARRIMIESGLDPAQITQVRAMADRELRVREDPYSGRNRRVTIMLLLTGGGGAAAADSVRADSLTGRPAAAPGPSDRRH